MHLICDRNGLSMKNMWNITFSVDTGHILDRSSRTAGVFGGNTSSLLLDLPQVAGRIVTRNELRQMRACPQSATRLPQHFSPPLSETWWKQVMRKYRRSYPRNPDNIVTIVFIDLKSIYVHCYSSYQMFLADGKLNKQIAKSWQQNTRNTIVLQGKISIFVSLVDLKRVLLLPLWLSFPTGKDCLTAE